MDTVLYDITSSDLADCWKTNALKHHEEKKEEIWLSSMTKAQMPTEMSKLQLQNKNTNQIVRLHSDCRPTYTVSWSNYSDKTGVVKQFTDQTFRLPVTKV